MTGVGSSLGVGDNSRSAGNPLTPEDLAYNTADEKLPAPKKFVMSAEVAPAPLGQRVRWAVAKPLLRLGWWIGR